MDEMKTGQRRADVHHSITLLNSAIEWMYSILEHHKFIYNTDSDEKEILLSVLLFSKAIESCNLVTSLSDAIELLL